MFCVPVGRGPCSSSGDADGDEDGGLPELEAAPSRRYQGSSGINLGEGIAVLLLEADPQDGVIAYVNVWPEFRRIPRNLAAAERRRPGTGDDHGAGGRGGVS